MAEKRYLVIVESPTKAKTIRKFLPSNYVVEASMGHIRDLPQSASDIPAALKKEEWAKLGVNVENDFEPLYIVPKDKKKIITNTIMFFITTAIVILFAALFGGENILVGVQGTAAVLFLLNTDYSLNPIRNTIYFVLLEERIL